MLLSIKAKPSSQKEEVVKLNKNTFKVFVKEPPVKGRANQAIINLLANYFHIAKSQIRIVKGEKSREKVIMII
jgi:hypothetical protein